MGMDVRRPTLSASILEIASGIPLLLAGSRQATTMPASFRFVGRCLSDERRRLELAMVTMETSILAADGPMPLCPLPMPLPLPTAVDCFVGFVACLADPSMACLPHPSPIQYMGRAGIGFQIVSFTCQFTI